MAPKQNPVIKNKIERYFTEYEENFTFKSERKQRKPEANFSLGRAAPYKR